MKKLLASLAFVLVLAGLGSTQNNVRVITRPKAPPREVLDRLNLAPAWKTRLAIDGERDGIFSLQLIPGKPHPQIVVQTIAGVVHLLDAETGDTVWRAQPSMAYWQGQPVGYNDQAIFVTRRNFFYILNRKDGRHRLYTLDKDSRQPEYGMPLAVTPTAAPAADEYMICFSLSNRVTAYLFPDYESEEKEAMPKDGQPAAEKAASFQPKQLWSYLDPEDRQFDTSPLLAGGQVTVASTRGDVLFLNQFELSEPKFFRASSSIAAPLGQYGLMAFVGTEDAALYAVDASNQRTLWRFLSGGPILRQPQANDHDVFVTADRAGLYRVNRHNGRQVWLNPQADRFLAANSKFVYAVDSTGKFLVLDYLKGTSLAGYDLRDWNVALGNELTDRIYLAANDGQILCLHHRDFPSAQTMKTLEKKLPPKKKEVKKEEPKDKEKEPEKEKEKEKDKEKAALDQNSMALRPAEFALLGKRWGEGPRFERRVRSDEALAWIKP